MRVYGGSQGCSRQSLEGKAVAGAQELEPLPGRGCVAPSVPDSSLSTPISAWNRGLGPVSAWK